MKPRQSSIVQKPSASSEFYHRESDNLLRVENMADRGVLIQVSRGILPSVQRRNFIRYLETEGFIPEAAGPWSTSGRSRITWVIDPTWPFSECRFNRYSRRLGWRLLLGVSIVWSLLMWMLVLR